MTVETLTKLRVAAVRRLAAISVHVVDDEEIEIAVLVEVGKRAARTPARLADMRSRCHVGKRAVTAIAIEHVRAEVRHVEVNPAVVVVVTRARAHAVVAMLYPRASADIVKRAVAAVVIQPVLRLTG